MPNRDDEELAVLLADLEETLTDLRAAIDEDVRRRRGRPPTPGELLRFTESYTIPTLIALLEATVRSLELLRAVLRLVGPRPARETDTVRGRSGDAPDAETLRAALTDLREALTGADLPEGSAAGSILSDARELTDEIDDRLARTGEQSDEDERRASSDRRDGVAIDVREEGADEADDGVDVESELESIKESLADEDADDDTEG